MSQGSSSWDGHHNDIDVTIPPADAKQTVVGNATIVCQPGTTANTASKVVMSSNTTYPNGMTWMGNQAATTWVVNGTLNGGATINFTLQETNTGTTPTNPVPTMSTNGNTTTYTFAAASGDGTTQVAVTVNPSGGGI